MTRQLVRLWEETLRQAPLQADSHFFARGGHSLLAVVLASRIQEMTGTEVTIGTVFVAPTPQRMAELLRASETRDVVAS
jgi:hypothetical protein